MLEAVRADGADVLADPDPRRGAGGCRRRLPIELLWAARGLLNEAQGLYDEARLAALDVRQAVRVDANHYDVIHYTASRRADAIDRRRRQPADRRAALDGRVSLVRVRPGQR